MSRLTVRLPDTLHAQLGNMAKGEGVSLNQYIVYALTRQVTQAYIVHSASASEVAEQRAAYEAMLGSLGQATLDEVKIAMEEREKASPERGLNSRVIRNLRKQVDAERKD